jgi:hypothetical protein
MGVISFHSPKVWRCKYKSFAVVKLPGFGFGLPVVVFVGVFCIALQFADGFLQGAVDLL